MAWKKSSPELIAAFERSLPGDPKVERRQMFGFPVGFVNGQMFTGLHEEKLILRLDEDSRAEFQKKFGAGLFEPMKGRPMREYVVATADVLGDPAALRRWSQRAFDYAAALPPKKPKKKKSKAR